LAQLTSHNGNYALKIHDTQISTSKRKKLVEYNIYEPPTEELKKVLQKVLEKMQRAKSMSVENFTKLLETLQWATVVYVYGTVDVLNDNLDHRTPSIDDGIKNEF
jgi:hypothetical protein